MAIVFLLPSEREVFCAAARISPALFDRLKTARRRIDRLRTVNIARGSITRLQLSALVTAGKNRTASGPEGARQMRAVFYLWPCPSIDNQVLSEALRPSRTTQL